MNHIFDKKGCSDLTSSIFHWAPSSKRRGIVRSKPSKAQSKVAGASWQSWSGCDQCFCASILNLWCAHSQKCRQQKSTKWRSLSLSLLYWACRDLFDYFWLTHVTFFLYTPLLCRNQVLPRASVEASGMAEQVPPANQQIANHWLWSLDIASWKELLQMPWWSKPSLMKRSGSRHSPPEMGAPRAQWRAQRAGKDSGKQFLNGHA